MGSFYVFEGDNGTGKSTACRSAHRTKGGRIYSTPSPEFEPIRDYIHTRDNFTKFLFYMSSVSDVSDRVREEIEESDIFCDRYILSSIIDYAILEKLTDNEAQELLELYEDRFMRPDLSIILIAGHEERLKRIQARTTQDNKRDNMTREYGERTNELYRALMNDRTELIDTTDLSIDEVESRVLRRIGV